jgi:hypothetical protein
MFGCTIRKYAVSQTQTFIGLHKVPAGMLKKGVVFRNRLVESGAAELLKSAFQLFNVINMKFNFDFKGLNLSTLISWARALSYRWRLYPIPFVLTDA